MIDLKLLGRHQLYFAVFVALLFQCTVLIPKVKFLRAEDFLEMCYQCSLTGVRCAIQPDEVLLGILSLK